MHSANMDPSNVRTSILSRGSDPSFDNLSRSLHQGEGNGSAPVERILILAEALFRMLDEMGGQMSQNQRGQPCPAPADIVENLPTRTWTTPPGSATGKEAEGPQCYICLSEYCDGDVLRCLPCKHEYHASCVDKWLKEVHQVCPLCRANVTGKQEDDDTDIAETSASSGD